jgi:hypothetical protein
MADFLIYWKNYWEDMRSGNTNFDEMWHTKQKYFYKKVQNGDNLWFVTLDKNSYAAEWRIISRVFVESKNEFSEKEKPYGVFGNKEKSQKFNFEFQLDFASVLSRLDFESGKKLKLNGRDIGKAIQQIRPLSETDGFLLREYSKKLKPL